MKRKVLITGVHGFLGRSLWTYIKKQRRNYEIFGIAKKHEYYKPNIFTCDLKRQENLKDILVSIMPDYIFHCAGGRVNNKKKLYELNFLTTKYLLDTIKKMKNFRPRIIIPGSAAEYGRMPVGRRVIKESDESRPLTWYGLIKLQQTKLALAYAQESGLDVIVARIFNIMGEGTPPTLVIGSFAEQIARIEKGKTERVILAKSLDSKRDFLDIDDVCRALLLIAQYGRLGQIYNVCSAHPVSIKELLRKLLSYSKVKNVVIAENKNNSSPSFNIIGSNAKLRAVSNWSPKIDLEQSLRRTLRSCQVVN